ncbi:pyridoxamine 5'-phosphate oxidase family protein [Amycolatopsis sp. cmx-4-83]|uniref:pyridoxamine 5'-phosphate oxidase family protein n=1 Tax=Amycolatopsis sp. cmx-4-83 TaxID=2790940 RepID=UPI00397B9EC3
MSYGPGRGPGPSPLADAALSDLLAVHRMGVLALTTAAGTPHLSTVAQHWDPAERVVRISTTADRLKVRLARRRPIGALHVSTPDFLAFAVAEGTAELSPVSEVPGDAAGRELLSLDGPYERAEDEEAFLKQMVADRRLVLRLRVTRLYGTALAVS